MKFFGIQFKIMTFLFLMIFGLSFLPAKDKNDKSNDAKNNYKNRDIKKDSDGTVGLQMNNKNKSENIRDSKAKKNARSKIDSESSLQRYISNYSDKLLDIQKSEILFIKEIKQDNVLKKSVLKQNNDNIRLFLNDISKNQKNFNNLLDKDQKNLIMKQNMVIKKSISDIEIIINESVKDSGDNSKKSAEGLFNKEKKIEDEINRIYRQFRAIEWILFEQ